MISAVINYFKTGSAAPPLTDPGVIRRTYEWKRWSIFISLILAGLIAVDIMPKAVAATLKGLIGMFAYVGAGTQDWISGFLIDGHKSVVAGKTVYDFAPVFYFWIGASVLSIVLATCAWNVRTRE